MHDLSGMLFLTAAMPLVVAGALLVFHLIFRFIVFYRLGTEALWIFVAGIPVTRIKYTSIVSIEILSGWPSVVFAWRHAFTLLRAGNRIGRAVVIRRRGRWLMSFVAITPSNPEAFVRDLERRRDLAATPGSA